MLASAAVGTVEYRSMTEPIRVTNPYIDNFVEGRAIGVDVPNRKLVVQLSALSTVTGAFKGIAANAPCLLEPAPFLTRVTYDENNGVQRDESQGAGGAIELSYDYLVCAVGTAARSSIVPGAKEHSTFSMHPTFVLYIANTHSAICSCSFIHQVSTSRQVKIPSASALPLARPSNLRADLISENTTIPIMSKS
jgi:NADH dehydrogenase FAD-containing subunit